uniref:(northern house mosquito) hypothetical protein n=1 Tax=Culex pipiens TaxID=7175 RepID=A0A8D8BNP4_CULPI
MAQGWSADALRQRHSCAGDQRQYAVLPVCKRGRFWGVHLSGFEQSELSGKEVDAEGEDCDHTTNLDLPGSTAAAYPNCSGYSDLLVLLQEEEGSANHEGSWTGKL